MRFTTIKRMSALSLIVAISGCATLSADGDAADVQQLVQGKTAGVKVTLTQDPRPSLHRFADPGSGSP